MAILAETSEQYANAVNVKHLINKVLNAARGDSGDEQEQQLYERFLVRVLLILFVAYLLFLYRAVDWQVQSRIWSLSLGAVIVAVGFLVLRVSKAYWFIAHAALLSAWIAVTNAVYTSGGFSSVAVVWLLVIPMLSVLLVGARQAMFWGAMCSASYVYFAIAQVQGLEFVDLTPPPQRFSQSIMHFVGAMLVLSAVATAFSRSVQRYRHSVNASITRQRQEIAFRREAEQAALKHSKAKSQFLASVSHELRTPLNSVIGFSHRVLRSGDLSERNREALEIINRNGLYLLEVINDLLDLNKIEAGKMELDYVQCNMSEIVMAVIENLSLELSTRGLSIESDIPEDVVLDADPVRVQQIANNLISNAIKYTDCGLVKVNVKDQQDTVELAVSDTGRGISEEMQRYLFDEYTAAAAKSHRLGQSTGLGLPLTYKLVQLHGGEFLLDSSPGVGTTVVVRLPKRHGIRAPAECDLAQQH